MNVKPSAQKFIIAALTLLAFGLRVYRLNAQSYWIDEAWTIFYARLSLPELWHYLQTIRAAPPLYHLLTMYWVQLLGDGEFALRYLSLLFSVMAVPLTYRLGKTLGGFRLGLLAASLMAVSPYQIWHAQDARNYSMLTAASVLSMWSFVALWRRGGWRWWLLYVFGTLLAVFTHYHGLMIIGVQGLFFLITMHRHWRYYLRWAAALLLILLPLVGWLTLGSTLWQADHWLPLVGMGESYWRSAAAYSTGELTPPPLALYFTLIFIAFYLAGLIYAVRQNWQPWRGWEMAAFLLAYTLAPNAAAWLYSLLKTPVYLERYLIVVQPAYLLAVSLGVLALAKLPRRRAGYAASATALLALLGINGWVLHQHYTNPAYAKENWRGVIQTIENFSQPGDAILLTGDGGEKLFAYYYHGNLPVYYNFNTPVPPPDQARQQLAQIAAAHRRLWFTPYGVEIDAVLEDWLAQNSYPAWHSWLGRKRLALYGLQADAARRENLNAQFTAADGSGLTLLSAELPAAPVAAGDVLPLNLTWQTAAPLPADYQLSVRLSNPTGDIFAQSDWPPLPAAAAWQPGQPRTDRRAMWLPADAPPGDYLLQLVVYNPATGQGVGQPVTIPGLKIAAAQIAPPPAALAIPNFSVPATNVDLQLIGHALPEQIQPGQKLWLWLYWLAQGPVAPDTALRVTLRSGGQTTVTDVPLADAAGSLDTWQPGQVRRLALHVPTSPRLAGDALAVSVTALSSGLENPPEIPVGTVALQTRARNFTAPGNITPLATAFGRPPLLTLLGYTQQTDSTTLHLTLFWRAEAEMDTNYTVFAQLLNPDGQVVAQQDSQPLAGAAPTTTWLPGEILADTYTLPLPPGGQTYRLITGLYNAATGQRLPAASGGDFMELPPITVR